MEAKLREINLLQEKVQNLPPEAEQELQGLRLRIEELEEQLRQEMTAWDHVQLSRHENRPYTLDYIELILDNFSEIHGDRKFADDPAMVGGMAELDGKPVMVMGQQKGRNTKDRIYRNYGMPKPEGYRKAIRLMKLAEKFGRPVLTLIDTPGAYPGLGAEERGQAEAIAFNLKAMASLRVPIIACVLGEGGSGGALAIGLADRVLMLENSIYSVISPESCSAILWKDQDHAREAAENLRLTAPHLERFGVIDEILPEPSGGAHAQPTAMAMTLKQAFVRHLEALEQLTVEARLEHRYQRFRRIGHHETLR